MGQKDGEKWTAAVDSQPTFPKPDRLLGPGEGERVAQQVRRLRLHGHHGQHGRSDRLNSHEISLVEVFGETIFFLRAG